jgi:ferredoxin--NADP+ reductase
MSSHNFNKVDIISNIEIQKGIFVLTLPRICSFTPGQVVSIRLSVNSPFRMYSLLNGANEKHYQLLYNIYPEGYLTNRLKKMEPGDKIYVSEPFGEFLSNYESNSYLIATGTGIAPFYSLFKSGNKNFTLLQGARKKTQFFFQDEFTPLGNQYIRCASKDHGEDIYAGRLTRYIQETQLPKSPLYFICGGAEMVVDVRELLQLKGIPYTHIFTEIYF